MSSTKTIQVSSVGEAIKIARRMFAEDGGLEFIIASGEATAGGVMLEARYGELVLHRSENGTDTENYGGSIEAAKAAIIASLSRSADVS